MSPSGRDRVAAALRLDRADRAPVSAWGNTYEREWSIAELSAATVGIARRCELDFVKLQIRATCFAEAFGAVWRFSGSPSAPPVMERPGGQDAEAWRRIADSEPDRRILAKQVEVLAAVARELGPETPCLKTVFSPGMVAWFLVGSVLARLLVLLREEPHLLASGLERIAETLAWFSRESIAARAAGVFYAVNPLANTLAMAPEKYEEIMLSLDRSVLDGAEAAWFNMLHLCGPFVNTSLIEALRPALCQLVCPRRGQPGAGGCARPLPGRRRGRVAPRPPDQGRHCRTGSLEAADALRQTGGRGHLLTPGCSVAPWPENREDNIRVLVQLAAEA